MSTRLSAEDRKRAILRAALPLFAEQGDAVTTKEIAAAAGASEALLYRHFDGKAGLYQELLEDCVEEERQDVGFLEDLPDSTSSLVVCAYVLVRRLMLGSGDADRDRALMRLQLHSVLGDTRFAATIIDTLCAPWLDKITRCFAAAEKSGDLVETATAADKAFWFTLYLAWSARVFGQPQPICANGFTAEAIFEDALLFLLRGSGVKKEAIDAYFNPKAFALMTAK